MSRFEYFGVCTRVIDGDTIEVVLDLGFRIMNTIRVRLADVYAPEIFSGPTEEREKGARAKAFLSNLLLEKMVMVKTAKDTTSFNRYVATVWVANEVPGKLNEESPAININELMTEYLVQNNLANAPKEKEN